MEPPGASESGSAPAPAATDARRPWRRGELAGLAGLVALALLLRLVSLGAQPADGDEVMHLLPLSFGEMLRYDLFFNPPMFRALVWLAAEGERTLAAARLVSVVAGTATVAVLYLAVRGRLGCAVAYASSLMLAVHPWHIRHSQTLRSFALLALLTLILYLLSDRTGVRSRAGHAAAGLVRLAVALTHYLAVFPLACDAVAAWRAERWRGVAAFAVPAAVAGVLLLPFLLSGMPEKVSAGTDVAYEWGLAHLWTLAWCVLSPGGLSRMALLALLVIGAWDRACRPLLAWAGAIVGGVLLAGLAVPIEPRYSLPALPFLLALAAAGGARVVSWAGRRGAWVCGAALAGAAVALFGMVWPLPAYYGQREGAGCESRRLHPDLVHAELDLGRVVQDCKAYLWDIPERVVLRMRGPAQFQLMANLRVRGSLPDDLQVRNGDFGAVLYDGWYLVVQTDRSEPGDGEVVAQAEQALGLALSPPSRILSFSEAGVSLEGCRPDRARDPACAWEKSVRLAEFLLVGKASGENPFSGEPLRTLLGWF